mgnify:CR=1 FL=1
MISYIPTTLNKDTDVYLVNPDTTYDASLGFEQRYFTKYAKPDSDVLAVSGDANFGAEFPTTPEKGDMFMRVDYLPTRLYKFNGNKWIMVDKDMNASYANNRRVIMMLMEKVASGEMEWEDLTPAEQETVAPYLDRKTPTA